jgi:hypothetical protein
VQSYQRAYYSGRVVNSIIRAEQMPSGHPCSALDEFDVTGGWRR